MNGSSLMARLELAQERLARSIRDDQEFVSVLDALYDRGKNSSDLTNGHEGGGCRLESGQGEGQKHVLTHGVVPIEAPGGTLHLALETEFFTLKVAAPLGEPLVQAEQDLRQVLRIIALIHGAEPTEAAS